MEVAEPKIAVAVPTLRFDRFKGAWKKARLDSVTDKIQDGTHFSPPLLEAGPYQYISARNIRNGRMLLHDMQYVDEEHHREIYKRSDVRFGDVLLTKDGASTGNVCLNELNEEFSLLSSVAFIRADDVKSTNEFIYQYLFSPYGQKEVKSVIAGQAITRITLQKLRAFRFHIPTLPEQQKIAGFLSAVDAKIQQLTRKKALLEQYKKGVMQQLFNQEIRFTRADGAAFPEWEEKRLGEIGKTYNGLTGKAGPDFGEGAPYITYKQIFDSSRIKLDSCGAVRVEPGENQSAAKYGDVFFTTSSETRLEVGFASVLLDEVDVLYLNSFCFGYRINSHKKFSPEFARHLFRSEPFRKDMVVLGQGSTRYNISKNEVKKLVIKLPSLEEQEKIAGFLSALDARVQAVQAQLEGAQRWKKGLLQQMFV